MIILFLYIFFFLFFYIKYRGARILKNKGAFGKIYYNVSLFISLLFRACLPFFLALLFIFLEYIKRVTHERVILVGRIESCFQDPLVKIVNDQMSSHQH